MRIEVDIKVDGGKVVAGRSKLIKAIQTFQTSSLTVTLEPKRRKRTSPQNALWWVYMTYLSEATGYTKDEIHEICKYQFLQSQKVDEKTGETFPYLRSTTSLSKQEFSELLEQLFIWAAQVLGVTLPEPNEQIDFFTN